MRLDTATKLASRSGLVFVGSPAVAPDIPSTAQGVVVDARRPGTRSSSGIIGITNWSARANAVAITPGLNVGTGTCPFGMSLATLAVNVACCTAAKAADCPTIHLTPGSHNVPGGFAWFKFGAMRTGPDLTGTEGRIRPRTGPTAARRVLNSKPFLDGEWGALPATPGTHSAAVRASRSDQKGVRRRHRQPAGEQSLDHR